MKRALSAFALSLLAACSSATGAGEDVDGLRVRTDQRVYALAAGGNEPVVVPFTAVNTASTPVAVARCGSSPTAELQRRDGGQWTVVSSGICIANLEMSPVQLAPGESMAGVVSVGRVAGTYRIRVQLGDSAPSYNVVRYAISPTFEVRWTDG